MATSYDQHSKKKLVRSVVELQEQRYRDKWRRFIDLYAGDHWPRRLTDQERITVNLVFSVINVIVPSITHQFPRITVSPEDPESEAAAEISEWVINSEWKRLDVQPEVAEAVKDGLIVGTGWVKCGWRRTVQSRPRSYSERQSEFEKAKKERDDYSERTGDRKSPPSDRDVFESIPTTQSVVAHDDIFVERLSPFDVFVDPDATDLKDARFIFQRVVKSIDEVLGNPKYDAKVMKRLKPDTYSGSYTHDDDPFKQDNRRKLGDDAKRVTLYEFWDIANRSFCVYAEGLDEPLYGPTAWPYDFLPFYVFRNYSVPDRFFGLGEVEMIESLQRELNKTRSQQINQRRQFHRKGIFKENAFYPQHLDELRSDRDGVFVPVRGNVPLEEALKLLTPPNVDSQLYQMSDVIKSDISEITAISEYERGQLPDIRRTATEASIIESASSARSQAKLAQVERLMAQIAEGILGLMREFYTEDRAVRAVGAKGKLWIKYNGDLIDGDYKIQVEGGSTQPRNDAVRKKEAQDLFQLLAGHPNVNQEELVKTVLRAYRLPGAERLIATAPAQPQQAPPGGPQGAPPPPGAPTSSEDAGPEVAGIPEELLAQLAGQVGPGAAPQLQAQQPV